MKVLILLSVVALSSCLPASRNQQYVDVDYNSYNAHPVYNFWRTWNQQHYGQEPWNQWVQYGVQNQPGNYWRQYVQRSNQAENVDLPWMYHSWDVQDVQNLTPVQRVQLLLNYVRLHQQWNQWTHDVTANERLQNMLYQHLPEHLWSSNEQIVPYMMNYFNQYPMKYNDIMHEVMQTPWAHQQLMFHVMSELYQHFGQAPWSHEQIMNQIMQHQYLYGTTLSQQQLQQLVEFVLHIQYELTPLHYQQLEQVQPWNREQVLSWNQGQVLPWAYRQLLPLNYETVLPWTRQYSAQNNMNLESQYNYNLHQQQMPLSQYWNQRYGQQYPQHYEAMEQPGWWNQEWTQNLVGQENHYPLLGQNMPLVY
ncbi:bifunctional endo-1,4-beta-xylanase XylA [Diabrotica virgifera virgifera]|uniref:Uncharacterized protein LOC114328795 n=1 Tax=Diabrotica virgifera virgifera TaxID=50390 RepID=A0A6P7FD00_DIAVI|nr:bifunctional endo-1,4-beta-xylanase XylA [Diabrotica virgifera virgifera]